MPKPKPWVKKTMKEKAKATIDRSHAAPAECLVCGIRVMPEDLEKHRETCKGRPEPSDRDVWLPELKAVAKGVRMSTLRRLAKEGKIRSREGDGRQEYLLRDVEQLIDARGLYG